MSFTKEQKIQLIITAFETYALGDIKKIEKNGMPIAAMILSACFIDQVSGFIYDKSKSGQKNCTDRSKKFVREYLNKVSFKPYDEEDLIKLLRNNLVHNYSVSDRNKPHHKRYVLSFDNPSIHLHAEGDIVVINIEAFISDLEKSFVIYKAQLLDDLPFQKNAIVHFDEYGILKFKEVQLKNV